MADETKPKKKFGGRQEGAGRPKGVPNKSTVEFREEARQYTTAALQILGEIIHNKAASFLERIKAIELLFDRAYGKATVIVEGSIDHTHNHEYETPEQARAALIQAGIPEELAGKRMVH